VSRPAGAPRTAPRTGLHDLPGHLHDSYGVTVVGTEALDLGTFDVTLSGGRAWIARVHPRQRPLEQVHGDAEVLRWLAGHDYPAERIADGVQDPVSVLHEQPVIVTEAVRAVPRPLRRSAVVKAGGLRALGGRLAQLQRLADPPRRPGGAWHHLADGAPAEELVATQAMLDDVGAPDALHDALARVDDGEGLPEAFTHPDFVMANVVCDADRDGALVFVDWSGAGVAPRAWPLGFLLWSVGLADDLARVDRAVDGYRRAGGDLTDGELERLPGLIAARPAVFDVWAYASGRRSTADAVDHARASWQTAQRIAERARAAFAA
jgi:Ser/Thr protein kinase RdoA (MazF antagonist)